MGAGGGGRWRAYWKLVLLPVGYGRTHAMLPGLPAEAGWHSTEALASPLLVATASLALDRMWPLALAAQMGEVVTGALLRSTLTILAGISSLRLVA